jgi:hypothetical protein
MHYALVAMKRISDIFSAWPSDADLGRDLGVPYPTISAWKQRDSIPATYWRDIIRAARKRGHPEITADLLVDLHALEPQAERSGFGEEERRFDTQDRPGANEKRTGHFSRFKHLRRDHFRSAAEIQEHIEKLRDEWSHR